MSLMPGMRVVGIFPRRFDADLAIARLESAGIEAVILSDTNPETGNLPLGSRGFRIAVRDEIAEDASTVLSGEDPATTAEIDDRGADGDGRSGPVGPAVPARMGHRRHLPLTHPIASPTQDIAGAGGRRS